MDHSNAVRANPEKQNYSVCPRHWYVNADFRCERCGHEFTWTAQEQRRWFEDFHFWIDPSPRHCNKCRAALRQLDSLRREYDADVDTARAHNTIESKKRIVAIVDELESALVLLPKKILDTRSEFQAQITKAEQVAAARPGSAP